ncbi:hypothetical protein BT63DRAFT_438232 [Microthyrium microscopicum]|uniref:Nuclear protein DGCR14 n=1 Tax=Microthyrium microscopicum TaxID=703497 RepID=A0A6A6ULQ2_9PEZI|nr:hypothetical protein BT63DRAFT_438232 [Microthyrium microscopicum]
MALPNKSTALIKKRKNELAHMPPPPPPKKIKRPATVLDEDTYLDGLSHIIARDYFPGLAAVDAQRDFLAALESKDDSWIRETGSKLSNIMDGTYTPGRRGVAFPGMTPMNYAGDTPSARSVRQELEKPKVNLNLGLGAYQAKYTSEDNESFNALVDKQNEKNRKTHAYLWSGNKIPSGRQIAWRDREARRLEASKSSMDLAVYRDTRPAMPNFKKSEPRNTFMFGPESIEENLETIVQASERKSNAPPKAILHNNTRLEDPSDSRASRVPASPSLSAINDALAGRPRLNESEAGWETPRVGGYAFVDAEPTAAELRAFSDPAPEPADVLSRLTKASAGGPNPFSIKEAESREKLHHRLVDKTKESKQAPYKRLNELMGGGTPGKTATPKFASAPKKQSGNLTPAGKRKIFTAWLDSQKYAAGIGLDDHLEDIAHNIY